MPVIKRKVVIKKVVKKRIDGTSLATPAATPAARVGLLDSMATTDTTAKRKDPPSPSTQRRKRARKGSADSAQEAPRSRSNSVSSSSSAESDAVADMLMRRSSLKNEDLLNRFVERRSDLHIEADIPEAREVPLITDEMKRGLKERKSEAAATPSLPTENSVDSAFGDQIVISFAKDENDKEPSEQRMPMWVRSHGGYTHPNRLVRLHDEVCDLVQYLKPTHEENVMRKFVVNQMTEIAEKLFPGGKVVVFGSLVTDLILPTSDVDMTICYDALDTGDNNALHEAMDTLSKYIQTHDLCDDAYPQVIKATKVPLVKFTHKTTWIDVDISFNAPNGRVNSEMVQTYRRRLPIITPLTMVVKYFLQQRGMHEPFSGGLGSYAISLMMVSFVQNHPAFQMGSDASGYGLGGLLIDFFRFYGVVFNFNDFGIDVGKTDIFRRGRNSDRAAFILKDPQNAQNNVAGSCRQLDAIRSAFHHAFLSLVAQDFPFTPPEQRSAEHPNIENRV